MSMENISLSTGRCLQETDEDQTACRYPSVMFERAFIAFDEAFKSSQWPVGTWHYYSKWVILPHVRRHLQKHSDVFQLWR